MGVYRKASRGSAIDRSARRANDVSEAVAEFKRTRRGATPARSVGFTGDIIECYVVAGLSLNEPCHVTDVVNPPTISTSGYNHYYEVPVFTAVPCPSGPVGLENGTGITGVAIDQIPAGGIGRVRLSGVIPHSVLIDDETHQYAEELGEELRSAGFGTFRILWKQPVEDRLPGHLNDAWCLLSFGGVPKPPWQWAVVTAVGTSTLSAKLYGPGYAATGNTITVYVFGFFKTGGTTVNPTLSSCSAKPAVGSIIRVARQALNTTCAPGTPGREWWMLDPVYYSV